jgi:hypothetical protein
MTITGLLIGTDAAVRVSSDDAQYGSGRGVHSTLGQIVEAEIR